MSVTRSTLLAVALLAASPAFAQNAKVSQLVPATLPLTGTELFYLVQGGVSKQTTVAAIVASGAVNSVSNSDGTLTISPTTGAVVASLALGHANTWTGVQTLDSPVLVTPALGTPSAAVLTNATGLPNAGLLNSSITIGSTNVSLGTTATALAGLASVASTTFVGALTGHASLDLPLTGGALTGALTDTVLSPTPTADGSVIGIFNSTKTAFNVYGGLVPTGWFNFDNTRSVIDLEPGTTVTNGNAFGAYCYDNIATSGGANSASCVGYGGDFVAVANGASVWGSNPVLSDSLTNAVSAGTGKKLIGTEYDISVTSPSTIVEGISMFLQGPSTPAAANAFQIAINSSTAKWSNFLVSNAGAATTALSVGQLTASSVANTASQPSDYSIWDSAGNAHAVVIQAIPEGTDSGLEISDNIRANGFVLTNAAAGASPNLAVAGSDTNINLVLFPKGSGSVIVSNLTSAGTSCVQASSVGALSLTGAPCGSGSGAVNSVANSDGTLTISPTTGVVVASLALGHANNWTTGANFSGNLGIGTTSPQVNLDVETNSGSGVARGIASVEYSSDASAPVIISFKSRGTQGSPSAVLLGDSLGNWGFEGYDGTNVWNGVNAVSASLRGFATENWSSSAHGSYLTFSTTAATTTTLSERMRIDNAGNIGIGTTTPGAKLEVNGAFLADSHILAGATSPTISACGTGSPTVSGSDTFGKIVAGGGALTSCVVNFGTAFVTAPDCVVSGTSSIAGLDVTASTTQLTIGGTSLTGVTVTFHCGSVS